MGGGGGEEGYFRKHFPVKIYHVMQIEMFHGNVLVLMKMLRKSFSGPRWNFRVRRSKREISAKRSQWLGMGKPKFQLILIWNQHLPHPLEMPGYSVSFFQSVLVGVVQWNQLLHGLYKWEPGWKGGSSCVLFPINGQSKICLSKRVRYHWHLSDQPLKHKNQRFIFRHFHWSCFQGKNRETQMQLSMVLV